MKLHRSTLCVALGTAALSVWALWPGARPAAGGGRDRFRVHCVNRDCPRGGDTHATIQEAVLHADPGETVLVGPGIYTETVQVDRRVALLGAQSGVDARNRTGALESIVNGPGGGFVVQANRVEIDGFVVEGASNNPGIALSGDHSGYRIEHNILRANTFGLYLNSDGRRLSRVRRNRFEANNLPGSASGDAIYSDQGLARCRIEENLFTGHLIASMVFAGGAVSGPAALGWSASGEPPLRLELLPRPPGALGELSSPAQQDLRIERNEMVDDGPIVLMNTFRSEIARNTSLRSRGPGIFLGSGNRRLHLHHNRITEPAGSGIRATTDFGGRASEDLRIERNELAMSDFSGISFGPGAVVRSRLVRNTCTNNQQDGIRLETGNTDNRILANRMSGNVEHDCHDDTVGSGTAGTANRWRGNRGATSQPPGLCD